jgi:hypothetical protein
MRTRTWSILGLCLMVSLSALAQHDHGAAPKQMSAEEKAMMEAWQKSMTPGAAHKQLDGMVGTWDTKVKSWMAPGAPAMESTGTSDARWVLGGRWIEQRFSGSFMGQPLEGIGYTGYDNVTKHYVGTWMDNMSTGAMVSKGSAAADGKTWNFDSTMADPMTGKSMPIKEKVVVVDNDHHMMEMWSPGPDGKMYKSMEIHYTRKK